MSNQFTEEEQNQLTLRLTQVLEMWKLDDQDQISLLALSKVKPRHLYLYRRGDKSFEFDKNLIDRAKMILGIYEALSTTYPTNRGYASIWMKRPVKKFNRKTPLELMLSGNTGMKRVWYSLDCTQAWKD
ncbi:hypothetical protein SPBRAN_2080 [uncultured Candidatus Thioglobus sp.]|nr:hypothetical protein SPBRAN_2080 [uncultured Candidatus Thioglobus sp.]